MVSGISRSALGRLLSCGALLSACSTRYADPIRKGPSGESDPCSEWTTQADCSADTAHGCSFVPNLVGCSASDPNCAAGLCRSGDPFVRRRGQSLVLHDAPYAFIGAVSWGIAWSPNGCQILASQEEALERTFDDLADARASVLKLWAFQSYAGETGSDYQAFDRVVSAARRAGVRLVFVLENHWPDCSQGTRDDAWYRTGYTAPYGGYALSLREYVRGLVTHFRDEPTVLAWEIMHEAQGDDFASLDGFARDMSSLIDESDPNHLIALGVDNGSTSATDRTGMPSNYSRLHEHAAIDLMDMHDFGSVDAPLSDIPEIFGIATSLNRAAFAGATAVETSDSTPQALAARAAVVERKLDEAMAQGFVGFLVYDYVPDWEEPSWSFDGRPEEPLAGPDGVIADNAPRVQ